jgi:hypothetical protein
LNLLKTYKTNYILPSELEQAKTSIDLVEVIKKSDFDAWLQERLDDLQDSVDWVNKYKSQQTDFHKGMIYGMDRAIKLFSGIDRPIVFQKLEALPQSKVKEK